VRVATLDIGTNSVLLLIAETGPNGLVPLFERATITRLGEGVDRTRRLAPAARERTLACIEEYARDIARYGVAHSAAVGTSALRDAQGGASFTAELARVLGFTPQVIDGQREAELTFRGALSGLTLGAGNLAVFDVGGGSTEIVQGTLGPTRAEVTSAVSLDIGSVRLFERHITGDPPSADEMARVDADIAAALATAPPPSAQATLVGVAGTVTTLASIALELDVYDPARVHGARLTLATVRELSDKLARLPVAERRQLTGLDPRRADVIVVGAAIVLSVLRAHSQSELVVSDRGVRFGLAEELTKLNTRLNS
jgi:exopolyphosphatase/guanosine-5'-triphosphate,3'-diphosphate pyrophosphatase